MVYVCPRAIPVVCMPVRRRAMRRFAASLFGSLLLLYLSERLRLSLGSATRWGGAFNALVYLSSVIGGVIADRWLGTRRAILIGATAFWRGLWRVVAGSSEPALPVGGSAGSGPSAVPPSISSAVGNLYEPTDRRRDDAFSIFYVVFNIGAACGPLAEGFTAHGLGWSAALLSLGFRCCSHWPLDLSVIAGWWAGAAT